MKKIFTLVMLSIFAVMNVNAEETTLWEGDWYVTWTISDNEPDASIKMHKEWGAWNADEKLNMDVSWAMDNGVQINVYVKINDMKDGENVYHKCQFDNYEWATLPGFEKDYTFEEDKVFSFVVTEDLEKAVKNELGGKGFRMHGHGFNVVKVTKGEKDATGINTVATAVKNDNRYYNLNGQVVANPTKGLYILNGKKVLVK